MGPVGRWPTLTGPYPAMDDLLLLGVSTVCPGSKTGRGLPAHINMPAMDGLALIRAIRGGEKREGRPRARIHVINAMTERSDLFASRLTGADGHVTKPMLLSSFHRLWRTD